MAVLDLQTYKKKRTFATYFKFIENEQTFCKTCHHCDCNDMCIL